MKNCCHKLLGIILLLHSLFAYASSEERTLRYLPDGEDFVIVNGDRKFTRALYGGHTGFRLETSDVPEFAFYLPHMGGNLSFSLQRGVQCISLNDADRVEARYRAGSRIYHISDSLLGKGTLTITAQACYTEDAALWQVSAKDMPTDIALQWLYGGASGGRFSREGDMGVDPIDCFHLKPAYCKGNDYSLQGDGFKVVFGQQSRYGEKTLYATFPPRTDMAVSQLAVERPELADEPDCPVMRGSIPLSSGSHTYYIYMGRDRQPSYAELDSLYAATEEERTRLASLLRITTPDPYFNTIGSALSVAADAIWNDEVWLHGAIGWRTPLVGWRAGYTGDALGLHDRARTHFNNYATSQVTEVEPTIPHPAQDSALNLARSLKAWGTPMYSNGYICRNPNKPTQMHHYDMNLCYIDELLWHLNWTGDWDYARQIWPVIERHLAWEKRNFDPDDDALYDAYCCIWASDALFYSGGAVTHSSAYNYRANRMAAQIASRLGMADKAAYYAREAQRIARGIDSRLWLDDEGVWAEHQDLMGLQRLHTYPAVWTIYHAIDSEVGTAEQRYRATQYIDREIPHIPVVAPGVTPEADGLGFPHYATIATTSWQPYAWSINNVAFAEVMHTALAYWQAGRYEHAFHLLKSSMLDGMYMGGSPGNFGQISHYDVARSECYRDFGDPIGVASRVYIQGLYGVLPDRLNNRLTIRPGFPKTWDEASLETPDIRYAFHREGRRDTYTVHLAPSFGVDTLLLRVRAFHEDIASVQVNGQKLSWRLVPGSVEYPLVELAIPAHGRYDFTIAIRWKGPKLDVSPSSEGFVDASQGTMRWIRPAMPRERSMQPVGNAALGDFEDVHPAQLEPVPMTHLLNDSVTNIFTPRYFSPRPPYTTLQIPVNGIGEWCHPKTEFVVNDSAMRLAERFETPMGVPFLTPTEGHNILFTSRWDNFPTKVSVPLTGKASHLYLMMAGSTNAMQSRIANGVLRVRYADGSVDSLLLVNPVTWCPIEQDYFHNGLAFNLERERPYRVMLATGEVGKTLSATLSHNSFDAPAAGRQLGLNSSGVFGNELKGGAGQLLDIRLRPDVPLLNVELETLSNDIVIGIMAITLQR